MALGPVSGEGRTGVVFLVVVYLVGVLGGIAGAAFDREVVLGTAAVERGTGTVFFVGGTLAAEAAGVSSAAGFAVEVSWNTAAGADRTGAVFLFEAFFFWKALGVLSGAAFNFEVVFVTSFGDEIRAVFPSEDILATEVVAGRTGGLICTGGALAANADGGGAEDEF